MTKSPLYVAGVVFALVALLHLYRLYDHFNVVVGTTEIPYWANGVGFIVAGLLSYYMFSSARESCCRK